MRSTQTYRVLAVTLVLAVTFPAAATDRLDAADGAPYVESNASQRSRARAEAACAQAGDAAAALGKSLQTFQGELLRAFTQTRIEATRELAPLMHRFADQLRDVARQLDQPPAANES